MCLRAGIATERYDEEASTNHRAGRRTRRPGSRDGDLRHRRPGQRRRRAGPDRRRAARVRRPHRTTTATAPSTSTDPGCSGPLDTDEYNPPPAAPDPRAPTPAAPGTAPRPPPPPHPAPAGARRQGHDTSPQARRRPPPPPAAASSASRPRRAARASPRTSARRSRSPPSATPDGSPTNANAGLTIAEFGAAPLGVPNFVIDQFEIPPFLLPIYHACGTEYGIPWQVLASINRIETAFGTNLNVSSAGAMGWMQFIPSSWQAYGVDANDDGRKDPYNPVDAICAAARYLKAAGGTEDLRDAIFAYNHADWYVDEVLLYANQYAQAPRRPRRLAHRPDRGRPLPGRRRRPLRRRHLRARGAPALQGEPDDRRQRRRRGQRLPDPPRHQHLLEGQTPRSSPSTTASSRRSARTRSSASTSS